MRKKKLNRFFIYSAIFHLILIAAVLFYFYKHPFTGGKSGTVMVGIVSSAEISQTDTSTRPEISEDYYEEKQVSNPELALKIEDVKEEIKTQKKPQKIVQEKTVEIAKQETAQKLQAQKSSDSEKELDNENAGQEIASTDPGTAGTIGNPEASGHAGYNTELAYPDYNHNPKPNYPRIARKRGYEGEVKLKVFVLSNGKVGKIEVLRPSGHDILDQSALDAVKNWIFVPGKENGKEVSGWVTVPITFQLKNG